MQALNELLAAKAAGGVVEHGAEPTAVKAPVVDLMAALQASIAESQARRGEPAAPTEKSTDKKTTVKKGPAKRAPRKVG